MHIRRSRIFALTPRRALLFLAGAWLLLLPTTALARVVRVTIDRRELIGGGASFGAVGQYERIVGRVYFAFDPKNPYDRRIVDLDLAPRNAAGEVEAWSEFVMLVPKDPSRRTGVTLVDVVNRGGMTVGVFQLEDPRDPLLVERLERARIRGRLQRADRQAGHIRKLLTHESLPNAVNTYTQVNVSVIDMSNTFEQLD